MAAVHPLCHAVEVCVHHWLGGDGDRQSVIGSACPRVPSVGLGGCGQLWISGHLGCGSAPWLNTVWTLRWCCPRWLRCASRLLRREASLWGTGSCPSLPSAQVRPFGLWAAQGQCVRVPSGAHSPVLPPSQGTTTSACEMRPTNLCACQLCSSTPRPLTTSPTTTRVSCRGRLGRVGDKGAPRAWERLSQMAPMEGGFCGPSLRLELVGRV